MAQTVVRGTQIRDSTIQRDDLDTSTVGNAVVAKLIQGAGITLTSTGADSGTGDVTVAASVPQGPAGPQGPPGHSSDDAPYKWDTGTAAADPGSGDIRMNALPASATHIYADGFDQTGSGVFGLQQLVNGSDIYLYETGAAGTSIHFKCVGTPVNNGPNQWFDVTVSLVANNGFTPSNNQAVQLYLPVKGAQGPPGTPGTQWWNGSGPPGTISGSNPGDYYLDVVSGDVYTL